MVPGVTGYRMTGAAHRASLPLLVLGPALGRSAVETWSACAASLTTDFDVLAWDLPGHGYNTGPSAEPFTAAELAAGVLRMVDDVLEQRGGTGVPFAYAGVSAGGAVGLQLLVDHPGRLSGAVLCATPADFGDAALWTARAQEAREAGSEGRAQVCEALSDFDLRRRLADVPVPVAAVAGGRDTLTPTARVAALVSELPTARLVELDDVGHLVPVEAPERVVSLIREVAGVPSPSEVSGSVGQDAADEAVAGRLRSAVLEAVEAGMSGDAVDRLVRETLRRTSG